MSTEHQIVPRGEVALTHLDGRSYADSRVIARALDNDHGAVMKMLSEYRDEFEESGLIRFEIEEIKGRGRPAKYALLSESQCYILLTYSRNSEAARAIKREFVRAFTEARQVLALSPAQQALVAAQALVALEEKIGLLQGQTLALEHRFDDQPISAHSEKRSHIQRLIQELGNVKGGRAQVGLAYRRFKLEFNLPGAFDALKVSDYLKAVEILTKWITEARKDHGSLYN